MHCGFQISRWVSHYIWSTCKTSQTIYNIIAKGWQDMKEMKFNKTEEDNLNNYSINLSIFACHPLNIVKQPIGGNDLEKVHWILTSRSWLQSHWGWGISLTQKSFVLWHAHWAVNNVMAKKIDGKIFRYVTKLCYGRWLTLVGQVSRANNSCEFLIIM